MIELFARRSYVPQADGGDEGEIGLRPGAGNVEEVLFLLKLLLASSELRRDEMLVEEKDGGPLQTLGLVDGGQGDESGLIREHPGDALAEHFDVRRLEPAHHCDQGVRLVLRVRLLVVPVVPGVDGGDEVFWRSRFGLLRDRAGELDQGLPDLRSLDRCTPLLREEVERKRDEGCVVPAEHRSAEGNVLVAPLLELPNGAFRSRVCRLVVGHPLLCEGDHRLRAAVGYGQGEWIDDAEALLDALHPVGDGAPKAVDRLVRVANQHDLISLCHAEDQVLLERGHVLRFIDVDDLKAGDCQVHDDRAPDLISVVDDAIGGELPASEDDLG